MLAERDDTRRSIATAELAVADRKRSVLADLDRQISDRVGALTSRRTADAKALSDALSDVAAKDRDVTTVWAVVVQQRLVVQGDRDLAGRRMDSAQRDVDSAQRNVHSIPADIRRNQSWYDRLPAIDLPGNHCKAGCLQPSREGRRAQDGRGAQSRRR